jgi:uncharacterized protein YybS (DUF2232 family)
MNNSANNYPDYSSLSAQAQDNQPLVADNDPLDDDSNWIDGDEPHQSLEGSSSPPPISVLTQSPLISNPTLAMVETAFLASASSLIWLINYYFPLGPILKIFFPIPIALVYLRWGNRASWMGAIVSGLLLSVLMGPVRSLVFLMPYGLMGVQLGFCWRKGANWLFSLFTGTLIGSFGLFFRIWLFSILLGENLWLYAITQVTQLADWIFLKLGLLAQPDAWIIQLIAITVILLNNLLYLFAVHLVALLVLDRLGNPIPRPPEWIKVILDYE